VDENMTRTKDSGCRLDEFGICSWTKYTCDV
jgi:hypothetical protein